MRRAGAALSSCCLLMTLGCLGCCSSAHDEPPLEELPAEIPTALATDERAGWLRDRIIEDNRDLMERYTDLSVGKFKKMASGQYNYFRGTANIFIRDATQPGPHNIPTSYGSADASFVLLVGDPHPENIGSFRTADDKMVIDFNDFDAATYGPYHLDVRRLALGFDTLAAMNPGSFDPTQRRALIDAVSAGYVNELEQITNNQGVSFLYERREGERRARRILGDLLRRAERDGDVAEELLEYAPEVDGERRMFYGVFEASEIDGVYRDVLFKPTDAQRALVEQCIQDYREHIIASNELRKRPEAFEIKGISVRLGAGVSSYPVQRYYVLVEGPTGGNEDDLLLEAKEILDPLPIAGLQAFGLRKHASNGARVVAAQRELQHTDRNDPMLGWADTGVTSMRIRHRTKYQKGVDTGRIQEKLTEGDWNADDVIDLAGQAGQLLAMSHARAKTQSGKSSAAVISAAIGGDRDGFITETSEFVETYRELLADDYQRFQGALALYGDTLGYRFSNEATRR